MDIRKDTGTERNQPPASLDLRSMMSVGIRKRRRSRKRAVERSPEAFDQGMKNLISRIIIKEEISNE